MTDYCENIVKLFVPAHMNHLVQQLVSGLADSDATPGKEGTWISFERLLPRPELFNQGDDEAIDIAVSAWGGQCNPRFDWGKNPPADIKDIVEQVRNHSPAYARAIDLVEKRIEKYGVASCYEWQMTRWGCKWNAMPSNPPQIHDFDQLPGAHSLPDYEGSTVIDYRFTTAYSPPISYLHALARLCGSIGVGMMAWYSDSDAYVFHPMTNDMEMTWTEIRDVTMEIDEISASRRLELAGGLTIEPDEQAEARIEKRSPIFRLFE